MMGEVVVREPVPETGKVTVRVPVGAMVLLGATVIGSGVGVGWALGGVSNHDFIGSRVVFATTNTLESVVCLT